MATYTQILYHVVFGTKNRSERWILNTMIYYGDMSLEYCETSSVLFTA